MGWPGLARVERWGVKWLRILASPLLHVVLVIALVIAALGIARMDSDVDGLKAMLVAPALLAVAVAFAIYMPVDPHLPQWMARACKRTIIVATAAAVIASTWAILTAVHCPPMYDEPWATYDAPGSACARTLMEHQTVPMTLMGLWAIVAPVAAGLWAAHAVAVRREDMRRVGGGPGGRWQSLWVGLMVWVLASGTAVALNAAAGGLVDLYDEPGDMQAVLWEQNRAVEVQWRFWFTWTAGAIVGGLAVAGPSALRAWAVDRLAVARMTTEGRDVWEAARPGPQSAALWRPLAWTAAAGGSLLMAAWAGAVPILTVMCSAGHGRDGSCSAWDTAGILSLVLVAGIFAVLSGVTVAACFRSWVQAGRRAFSEKVLADEAVDVRAAYSARRISRDEFDAWFAARTLVLEPKGQQARDARTASWLKAGVIGTGLASLAWGLAHLAALHSARSSQEAWREVAWTYEPAIDLVGPAWWPVFAGVAVAMWIAWRAADVLGEEGRSDRQQRIEHLRGRAEEILHRERARPQDPRRQPSLP